MYEYNLTVHASTTIFLSTAEVKTRRRAIPIKHETITHAMTSIILSSKDNVVGT